MEWTFKKPSKTGWYWCRRYGRTRMVNVWGDGKPFFTNEDGGAPIDDDDLYGNSLWYGPIIPPNPPKLTDY
jgi:hypothetical protein